MRSRLAAIGKLPGIAHGADHRGGRQGAQARQCIELAAKFIRGTDPFYPCIITGNPLTLAPLTPLTRWRNAITHARPISEIDTWRLENNRSPVKRLPAATETTS